MATVRAWHFLRDDMRSGKGNEPPWALGETRTIEGEIKLCHQGYHASPTPFDALQYAPGSMLCEVAIDVVEQDNETNPGRKMVGRSRTLLSVGFVERQLRLFACDCAERALEGERQAGREPDTRSWNAVAVMRRYIAGEATEEERSAASSAADSAASSAAYSAASSAAYSAASSAADSAASSAAYSAASSAADSAAYSAADSAAYSAADSAADSAAYSAEREWQRERLNALLASADGTQCAASKAV